MQWNCLHHLFFLLVKYLQNLKVSKSQKQFMVSSILLKNKQKQFNLKYYSSKVDFFVHFLRELKILEMDFEMGWPLALWFRRIGKVVTKKRRTSMTSQLPRLRRFFAAGSWEKDTENWAAVIKGSFLFQCDFRFFLKNCGKLYVKSNWSKNLLSTTLALPPHQKSWRAMQGQRKDLVIGGCK